MRCMYIIVPSQNTTRKKRFIVSLLKLVAWGYWHMTSLRRGKWGAVYAHSSVNFKDYTHFNSNIWNLFGELEDSFVLLMNSSRLFHELAWIHPESSWHRFTRTPWAGYFKISSQGESFCSYQYKLGLKILETMKLDNAQRICFVKMSKSPTGVRCSSTTHTSPSLTDAS